MRANLPRILEGKKRKREKLREKARKGKKHRAEVEVIEDVEVDDDDLNDDDDPEKVLEEEVNKLSPLTEDQMLIETFAGKFSTRVLICRA